MKEEFEVKTGSVTPVNTHHAGTYSSSGHPALAPTEYTIGDCNVQVKDLSGTQKSPFLVIQVPSGKGVSISKDGTLIFFGNVTRTLALVDGNILHSSGGMAVAKAVLMLMVPCLIEDEFGPDVVRDEHGVLTASTAGLRKHLVSLPTVTGSLEGVSYDTANGQLATVLLRLHINTQGKVTSVRAVHGSAVLYSRVENAVMAANFKPFEVGGMPTEVDGFLEYTLDKNGELSSSITN
jgi:hypothetical protein